MDKVAKRIDERNAATSKIYPNLRAPTLRLNVRGEGKRNHRKPLTDLRTGEAEARVFLTDSTLPREQAYLPGAPALPVGGPQSE